MENTKSKLKKFPDLFKKFPDLKKEVDEIP
jgi:hypothetical protein